MSSESSRMPVPSSGARTRRFGKPRRPSGAEIVDQLVHRYGGLPAWVLLVQIFLAAGWMRAAAAHSLSTGWWSGEEITTFGVEHRDTAVAWYSNTMLDGPVTWFPIGIAIVVLVGQLTVAGLLGFNHYPLLGLGIGVFLNTNFVLAGAVDPSAFYLVIGAAIALWHVEATTNTVRCWWLTLASTVLGFTFVGSLAPQISTLDPALVIDDPAMVLTFITLLWIAGLWLVLARRTLIPVQEPTVPVGPGQPALAASGSPKALHSGEIEPLTEVARRAVSTGELNVEKPAPQVKSAELIAPPPKHRSES